MLAARTGTFYGQPMTAGDIYTVAGDGIQGFSGGRRPGHQRRTQPGGGGGGRRREDAAGIC